MNLKVHMLGLVALGAMGFSVSAQAEVEFIGTPHAVEAVSTFQGSPTKAKAPRAIPFRTIDPEALARAKKRIGPPAGGAMTNEITPSHFGKGQTRHSEQRDRYSAGLDRRH